MIHDAGLAKLVLRGSLLVILTLVGCRLEPREIEFVVPAGFHGPFIIITGTSGQSGAFRNGKVTINVPKSRIVVMDDDSAFLEMTRWTARFADGRPLSIGGEVSESVIALRGGGHSSGMSRELIIPPHSEFFVGTDDEFVKADFADLLRKISSPRPD